jgi:hypothetical protein
MRTIFAIQTDRFAEILARQHRVVSDFRRYAGEPVALGQPPDMRKAQVRGNRRVVRIFEIGRGQRGYQRREVVRICRHAAYAKSIRRLLWHAATALWTPAFPA